MSLSESLAGLLATVSSLRQLVQAGSCDLEAPVIEAADAVHLRPVPGETRRQAAGHQHLLAKPSDHETPTALL